MKNNGVIKFNISKKDNAIISTMLIILSFFLYKTMGYTWFSIGMMLVATMIAGVPVLKKAIVSIKYRVIGIDALVTIAVVGALFIHEYWEAAAVTYLFMIGDFLEAKTIEKTRASIKLLLDQHPKRAIKLVNDVEVVVDPSDVNIKDHVIVKTGEKIPVDGVIIKGNAFVNQSAITGESLPVEVDVEDKVFATTIVESGYLIVESQSRYEDSVFSKIVEMVEEAQDKKAKTQKLLERFSQYYTPLVVLAALIMYVITQDLVIALTLLVIACPGALVISTPVSIVAGIGNGAKKGILFKGGDSIERLNRVNVIAFDKTGTLTQGKASIIDIKTYGETVSDMLKIAAIGETYSEHPLAKAIINYAKKMKIELNQKPDHTQVEKGMGVIFELDKKKYFLGNQLLMSSHNIFIDDAKLDIEQLTSQGSAYILLADHKKVLATFEIADKVREEAKILIRNLKKMGKHVVMLTGDQKAVAHKIAQHLELHDYYAQLLPKDKADVIETLKKDYGYVAMIGDGVNDAPALAYADVGIAIGNIGSDIVMETADAILLSHDINKLSYAFRLAKATIKNMSMNITFALMVAGFLLIAVMLKTVNLSIGMLIHELSVLIVILHAFTLLHYKERTRDSV